MTRTNFAKSVLSLSLFAALAAAATPTASLNPASMGPEVLSQLAAKIIASGIPHEFEGSKDWGNTKEITTGLHSYGNFFKFDIHREKSDVNHGIWKQYKLTLVDPDKNLQVAIENLHTLESGRVALTLNVAAKVHGWGRTKIYDRGIHIIALEAEGDTDVRIAIDAEIGIVSVKTDSILPGYALDPVVTNARIKFADFDLKRISDLRGPVAHEIGILLREAVEDELKGKKLTNKINHAIDKKRGHLQLTPEMLLGKWNPKQLDEPKAPASGNAASK